MTPKRDVKVNRCIIRCLGGVGDVRNRLFPEPFHFDEKER